MILLVIASLFLCPVLGDPIVGGHACNILAHPWLVAIHKDNRYTCVGSIISESVILTVAHCVEGSMSSYTVHVGSSRTDSGGTWHKAVARLEHEQFTKTFYTFLNDVAVIKVSPPFEFSTTVKKIQLADAGYVITPGTSVSVAGWGSESYTSDTIELLKSTNLQIVDSRECSRAYGDPTGMLRVSSGQICAAANGTDACSGDSGAPLVLKNIQVGIVLSGVDCAHPKYPGVYVDVARYRPWIDFHRDILQPPFI